MFRPNQSQQPCGWNDEAAFGLQWTPITKSSLGAVLK